MYRPLPDNLTIKKSNIEGLGLFADKNIEIEHIFGITHIQHIKNSHSGYIRTPLGGFINNSDNPNCILIHEDINMWSYMKLKSIKCINEGEEITLKYQYMGYQT